MKRAIKDKLDDFLGFLSDLWQSFRREETTSLLVLDMHREEDQIEVAYQRDVARDEESVVYTSLLSSLGYKSVADVHDFGGSVVFQSTEQPNGLRTLVVSVSYPDHCGAE